MKNTIPLVIAVVLGLIAVFAVSKQMQRNSSGQHGKGVDVLVVNGPMKSGKEVVATDLRSVSVPLSFLPKRHILNDQKSLVIGQKLVRDIAKDDYIQWDDIGQAASLGDLVGEGEWAVPVGFANPSLVKLLKAGDDIAIVGMFEMKDRIKGTTGDADEEEREIRKTVTSVLYPKVRIMGMIGGGTVLLSLPPQQALAVIAAQKQATLYAALRRPHDEKATNRKDNGLFDGSAFSEMLNGLPKIAIPDQPFNK